MAAMHTYQYARVTLANDPHAAKPYPLRSVECCGEASPVHLYCTLPVGHDGSHHAHNLDGHVMGVWAGETKPPAARAAKGGDRLRMTAGRCPGVRWFVGSADDAYLGRWLPDFPKEWEHEDGTPLLLANCILQTSTGKLMGCLAAPLTYPKINLHCANCSVIVDGEPIRSASHGVLPFCSARCAMHHPCGGSSGAAMAKAMEIAGAALQKALCPPWLGAGRAGDVNHTVASLRDVLASHCPVWLPVEKAVLLMLGGVDAMAFAIFSVNPKVLAVVEPRSEFRLTTETGRRTTLRREGRPDTVVDMTVEDRVDMLNVALRRAWDKDKSLAKEKAEAVEMAGKLAVMLGDGR